MKPLQKTQLDSFLKRFEYFKDGELLDITVVSPTVISLKLTTQDSAKEFDWIGISFEFSGVCGASLIENSKLSLINMEDGINITYNGTNFAFSIKNSTCHIESSYINFEEGQF